MAKYTIATTLISATIALFLFVVIAPVDLTQAIHAGNAHPTGTHGSYWDYIIHTIPSNIVQPFVENNVIGVLLIAMALSLAILSLPSKERGVLHTFFSSCYMAMMKLTTWILKLMPIAIFAFITLFIKDLRDGMEPANIVYYLLCVVLANLIQATFILPTFLKAKGLSPMKLVRGMFPALSIAFFSKSSSGALPMAMKCAEENVKIPRKVASFTLPLCTTINMNGCAAFILTTVLFVSMSNGTVYTGPELIAWIFIATIAAIGNAGVPMGCYFLSSAILAAMNVPLNILAIILPFYTLIDMLESAINVWSDSCVMMMVDQEISEMDISPATDSLSEGSSLLGESQEVLSFDEKS